MSKSLPALRAITRGPKHHWFGYYDKLELDPGGRYVLGMEVGFTGRSPRPDDAISVGMVDLDEADRWIALGESRAWCWQQGCMLQWRPGSSREVLWNDREGDHFVCRVLDVETRDRRTLPFPVYAVSPDGTWAVAPDFRRVNHVRPGYGYAGLPDPHRDVLAPPDSGIRRLDLETGEQDLILSIADVVRIPWPHSDFSGALHYFNHLLVNPDGTRFIFLHRWRVGEAGWKTRLMTAAPDGSDVRVVDDYGEASHFIWRDPAHILAWARRPSNGWAFYLYEDGTEDVAVVGEGVMTQNGHCTYLPGNDWILNDTYPDENREQHLYLYHVATGKKVALGSFHAPDEYRGEWRCDLHPRSSPDGRRVVIDSIHEGHGRQLYILDISGIVGR